MQFHQLVGQKEGTLGFPDAFFLGQCGQRGLQPVQLGLQALAAQGIYAILGHFAQALVVQPGVDGKNITERCPALVVGLLLHQCGRALPAEERLAQAAQVLILEFFGGNDEAQASLVRGNLFISAHWKSCLL